MCMNPQPTLDPAQAPPGGVAGDAAHTLNNITGILYAALDYLEEPVAAKSAERARKAIDRACAQTLALSAALSLLALGPADAAAALARGPVPLADTDMERVVDTLHTACGVELPVGTAAALRVRTPIDRDTLQALLVCGGTLLRRATNAALLLRCRTDPVGGSAAPTPRVVFDMVTSGPVGTTPGAAGGGAKPHLCAMALAHASLALAPLGVTIDLAHLGAGRVVVELEGEAP